MKTGSKMTIAIMAITVGLTAVSCKKVSAVVVKLLCLPQAIAAAAKPAKCTA